MLAAKLLAGGGTATLYSDDVFAAYTRTGTGASATVTTGIDMTQGYMLWTKGRSGATDHAIYDSGRGTTKDLVSNTTAAQTTQATGLTAVSATGHTIGALAKMNTTSATYVDWVFRKAERFFDVVTWTGDGTTTGRVISHALGQTPGMVVVKGTSQVIHWYVWHNGLTAGNYLLLSATNAQTSSTASAKFGNGTTAVAPTSTGFTVGADFNTTSETYVAYLFAHDTSTDGLIQCGSLPTSGSVTLGWEPQFVLWKDAPSGWWYIYDTARGFTTLTSGVANGASLNPNNSNAESFSTPYVSPNPTGFTSNGATGATSIYLAIRRPNKPPTTGTQVYNAIARTGTGAAATVTGVGFAPDLAVSKGKDASLLPWDWQDRLRGATKYIKSNDTAAEATDANSVTSFNMDGVALGSDPSNGQWNYSGEPYGEWFFKRAPGVFDVVCYTGTGSATTVSHGLGAVPELMIVKGRSIVSNWFSYYGDNTKRIGLESASAATTDSTAWNNTTPTASVFSVGTANNTNYPGGTFVAYLFATKAGISKVGSYTGNGSSQTINCGFTTGARFILIKRTDSTGDWYVWDTVRGIVAGNDPHLSLNTTAAEVTTDDSIDPDTSGFIVNELAATHINVTSATYIFLALA